MIIYLIHYICVYVKYAWIMAKIISNIPSVAAQEKQ